VSVCIIYIWIGVNLYHLRLEWWSYQTENDSCLNGISKDGIIFESESCGVKFSHANWQEPQVVKINGQSDLELFITP
jgi:hypothetical protein